MSSRALSLATVLLLIDFVAVDSASAQAQNLEAGKSPSQLFAQTCSACHKSPRGLLKTVPAGSLSGFLRQHYTTSPEMAGVLSSYLVSNGATDTRYGGGQAKGGKDAGSGAAQSGTPDRRRPRSSQEVSKPDSEQAAKPDGETGQPEGRAGQRAKRGARPGETPEAAKPQEEQTPAEATNEHGSDGRKHSRKQKLGKHGKPVAEEPAKGEAAKEAPAADEKSKSESTKSEPAPSESKDEGKAESAKPAAESKPVKPEPAEPSQSESAKAAPAKEGAAEAPVVRSEPVKPADAPVAAKPASAAGNGSAEPATTASEPSASTPAVPPISK